MLNIKNVTKHFGGVAALERCSMEIEAKKITAIIGPNGSGKTTLFNAISRIMPIDRGDMHFAGTRITDMQAHDVAKLGISRTFQKVRLFHNLTIKDHLEIAMRDGDEDLFRSVRDKRTINEQAIKHFLDLVKLDKPLETLATDLSYGQRKLLDLAVALAKPHALLMLDEPVAGVNPALRKIIKDVVRSLNKKGETILVIEHDMNFVMDLAHHIIVLDAGKVIAEGKPKDIKNNKKVLDAYLGN